MSVRRIGFGLFLAGFAIAIGCGGVTTSSAPSSPTTQTIGAAGGSVSSSDGSATATIPAGALTADIAITITETADAVIVPNAIAVGAAYTFAPDGLTFAKPITITMAFDASQIPDGYAAADIIVDTAPDGSSTFSPLPTTLADATHVNAVTTHFCTNMPIIPSLPGVDIDGGEPQDTGSVVPSACETAVVTCESDENIDGGTGCDCSTTCAGVTYQVQCICGLCTCYQNGVTTGATTTNPAPYTMCSPQAYFNTCGFPGSKNQGGGGGPVDASPVGTCN